MRDLDLASGPLHQRDADLVLEPADLLRQGRLCDVLPSGGASEVTLLSQGHQVAQLPEFHKESL